MKTLWFPWFIYFQMLHILSTHYPEMVKEVLIINSNNLFPDFYLSLRPYIERKLRDKITVLGANFLKWVHHQSGTNPGIFFWSDSVHFGSVYYNSPI